MIGLQKNHAGHDGVMLCDVETPVPDKGMLRIKVAYSGICGTDLHIIKDEYQANYPVIMGHEFSGTVDCIGPGVDDFSVGDKVVALTAAVTCNKCEYCKQGLYMHCSERKSIGSGVNGAFAEYLVMDSSRVFKLPEGITLKEAALTEPVACVVRGVIERSSIKAGDFVYVSGPGTIGQITAQVAKLCGAVVIVGGTTADTKRLDLALELGADYVIDVIQQNPVEAISNITKGTMCDVAYECAGATKSAQTCVEVLRQYGEYAQVGLFGKNISFDMDQALIKENRITNTFGSEPTSWLLTLRLMSSGKLNLSPLISEIFALDDWEKAIEMAENKTGYKILFSCS